MASYVASMPGSRLSGQSVLPRRAPLHSRGLIAARVPGTCLDRSVRTGSFAKSNLSENRVRLARPIPLGGLFDIHSGRAHVTLKSPLHNAPQRHAPVAAAAASEGAPAAPQESKFLGIPALTWQKVIPLGIMFFFILFNYTLLRNTKDVLIVTAPGGGAEVIPFLKTWVNLPSAIAFTVFYTKLSNIMNPESLFYTIMSVFVAFFMVFAFVMYPAQSVLHPSALADKLLEMAPRASAPIAILRNWTCAMYYVIAEMWGSVVTALLFWGCANAICTVDEAQQFYPLFGMSANVALIFAGAAVKFFSNQRANLPPGVDGWGYSLKGLMSLVAIGAGIVTAAYFYLQRAVVPKLGDKQPLPGKKKKKKANMTVGESFKFLAASPYIRSLALLVVCYGVSINLVEVTWKSKLKMAFPDPNNYSSFMADFSAATGVVTLSMMVMSRFIFSRFGWGMAALITPSVMMVTGILFFGLVLCGDAVSPMLSPYGLTPLMGAVLVGAVQNIFSKASKYSLFDPCKEMAYIPLDQETQMKGKAAIDVVCSPLGKSGGSLIQQFLIVAFGSLSASTPYLGVILLGIVGVWIGAANTLAGLFEKVQSKKLDEQRQESVRELQRTGSTVRKFKIVGETNQQGFLEAKVVPLAEGEVGSKDDFDGDEPVCNKKLAGALHSRAFSRSLSSKSNRGGATGMVALSVEELLEEIDEEMASNK